MRTDKRSAFITGGAGGFGRAFAQMALERGLNVALADIDYTGLEAARDALGVGPERLTLHVCDALDRDKLRAAALAAREALGAFAFVCLNAGILGAIGPVEVLSEQDWRRVLDANLIGPAAGAAVFLPLLREQPEGGRLVFTASMAGLIGQPHGAPYSASKAGVIALAESLALETKGTKVKVSVLCPGFARTPLVKSMADPSAAGPSRPKSEAAQAALTRSIASGLPPDAVAVALARGLDGGDFYIFTHGELRPWLARRMRRIAAAYEKVLG
jgi:NAD(P)-dependent dehydrogenase (short-subunit alcohol dehydrogenase family)